MTDIIANHNHPWVGSGGKLLRTRQASPPMTGYGLLYNFWVGADARLIKTGWHVPTNSEWDALVAEVGGWSSCGGLKEAGTTRWHNPNTGTNSTGFTAVGGGQRASIYDSGTVMGYYWASNISSYSSGFVLWNDWDDGGTMYVYDNTEKRYGCSIRLIKDDSTNPGTVDIDGLTYSTVKIGSQVWLASNLKATHYANGDGISEVTNQDTWDGLTSGALCAYDNDWNNV